MAKIKVLIEGYADARGKGWKASSTTCLVVSGTTKIITDPGCNREKLFAALRAANVKTGDIDYVFLSHCHPDHILLAAVFENAKYVTFDGGLLYDNDMLVQFDKHVLGDDIEIVETPGHVPEHLSLVVDTNKGKVAIAGDVIWWGDGEVQVFDINQNDHSQAVGMDKKALVESRKKLIQMSDYIIPGHGKEFKIDK